MSLVRSSVALRGRYPAAPRRAVAGQLDAVDRHRQRFIELTRLVVAVTSGDELLDRSPRGRAGRGPLPLLGEMPGGQTGDEDSAESRCEMVARQRESL